MPTGAVIAEQSVRLLPVEPCLGAPQHASHAEVQIILRKNMYDWGVSSFPNWQEATDPSCLRSHN